MGLLGRIFGGDPAKDLEKARRLLDGDPARAMTMARKLADSEVAEDAKALIQQARTQLFENAINMAKEAEESEYFEDAAEWIDRALEQLQDEDQRQKLEAHREMLLDKAEAEEEELPPEVDDAPPAEEPAFEASAHIDAIIGMLSDDIAQRYDEQGDEFRSALAKQLNNQIDEAVAILDGLIEKESGNGPCHLERGRCRLITGDTEGARDDFDIAWQDLGSGPLFAGRPESAPGLWADAQLSLDDSMPVIERLDDLADPASRRSDICVPFAAALVSTEHFEEADGYLRRARREMPGVHDLTHLHATVLVQRGDPETAIMALETVVAPACAGGTCRPAAMHVPSLRMLIALHIEHGEEARAKELAVHLAQVGDGPVADTASLQPDRSATVI